MKKLVWLLHLMTVVIFAMFLQVALQDHAILSGLRGLPGMLMVALFIHAFGAVGVQLLVAQEAEKGLGGWRLFGWWLRYHFQLLAIVGALCVGVLFLFNGGATVLEGYLPGAWVEKLLVLLAIICFFLVGSVVGWLAQHGYLKRQVAGRDKK